MTKLSQEDIDWMNAPMGPPVKRIGYKTLRGFISMLKKQNKSLKKLGCVADFTIRLPIRY